ncbi:MAG: HAD-IIB family hydrolase [Deltaproteobacteria bacterium]|nr:HAD-IIB family hydrolase [Deltaproteobacteria bacterium]
MQPLRALPSSVAARIDAIYSDLDDTISTGGRVSAAAFAALWRAQAAGVNVVLVTGRPAGWCDHLARMWPLAAVVGENGALAFACEEGRMRRIYAAREPDAAARLAVIRDEVLATVPGCKVSADQPYREYDLAIDFCEEVPPLPEDEVDRIAAIFRRHGATAKVSSIHVNGWFGSYDKLSMCRRAAGELLGAPLDPERAVFVGDSPNDEPMFRAFPHAVGVANVRRFAPRLAAPPSYVADAESGAGFTEVVDYLLAARGK